jgi:hypothetical protein
MLANGSVNTSQRAIAAFELDYLVKKAMGFDPLREIDAFIIAFIRGPQTA